MQIKYKVVGMSAPKSFTLFESNDHCWAKDGLPEGQYKALFTEITATVECESKGIHNSPINGMVKEVFINGLLFKP